MKNDVIIVGTGLAGLSTALDLIKAGRRVLLLEEKPYVGGRTSSWNEAGMPVESGLHRVLGFYRAFPNFLKRTGIKLDDIVYWEDEIEIRIPDNGPKGVFGVAPLHKPLKTMEGLLGNHHLFSWRDKWSLMKFFAAGFRELHKDPEKLDSRTVLEFARTQKLNHRTIDRFLIPFTAGLFFLQPGEYSAYAFFGQFAPYLHRLHQMRVGAFRGGMTEIMMQPVTEYLLKNGAQLQTNAAVEKLYVSDGEVKGVYVKGELLEAEHVVLATSLKPAQTILQKHFSTHPWFEKLFQLPSMPSVTLQIELDRPALSVDRTIFGPTTAMASFSEQSRTTFRQVPGRLSVILTSPYYFLGMDPETVLNITRKAAYRLNINLEKIRDYRVIVRPDDFYSPSPGAQKLRPKQKTAIPGLTLAGDYTKQKYMGNMEGAVVSGRLAAKAVLHR
jgi:15-cis-phytoene desaturase